MMLMILQKLIKKKKQLIVKIQKKKEKIIDGKSNDELIEETKSVINGLILSGAIPVFVIPQFDHNLEISNQPSIDDYIKKGDILMTLYTHKKITEIDNSIFKIANKPIKEVPLIYEIIK